MHKPIATLIQTETYDQYLRLVEDFSEPTRLDMVNVMVNGWLEGQAEIDAEMRANGYHRCPDGIYRRTPSNGMFDGLCNVCESYMDYDDEPEAPVTTLPEIVFDDSGYSQPLTATSGDIFYIFRCRHSPSKTAGNRFLLTDENKKPISLRMAIGGILALATSRVRGGFFSGEIPEAEKRTADDERNTNYGAF